MLTRWGRALDPDAVLPDGFAVPGVRVPLPFGAVDQECRVFLGGVQVEAHEGG